MFLYRITILLALGIILMKLGADDGTIEVLVWAGIVGALVGALCAKDD